MVSGTSHGVRGGGHYTFCKFLRFTLQFRVSHLRHGTPSFSLSWNSKLIWIDETVRCINRRCINTWSCLTLHQSTLYQYLVLQRQTVHQYLALSNCINTWPWCTAPSILGLVWRTINTWPCLCRPLRYFAYASHSGTLFVRHTQALCLWATTSVRCCKTRWVE